jgi:hypothetical protein
VVKLGKITVVIGKIMAPNTVEPGEHKLCCNYVNDNNWTCALVLLLYYLAFMQLTV